MELRCGGLESKYVIWDIHLPRSGHHRQSPTFSLHGTSSRLKFRIGCCAVTDWVNGKDTEIWSISCKGQGSHLVVPYIQKKGLTFESIAREVEHIELQRDLLKHFGIEGDNITMLFLFVPETLSISKDQSCCIPIQSLSLESLSKDLIQLLDNKEHSDAVLTCGDSSFPVHKNILATRSDVFAAMFRHDMEEKNTGVVDIEDMDSSVLEQFVKYLYSGKVEEISVDKCIQLYQVADKYAVQSLKDFCASFISENLSKDVVCRILLLADQVGDAKLLETAACFASALDGFLKTQEWREFATKYPRIGTNVFLKYINNT